MYVKAGSRSAYKIQKGCGKANTTVLFCINALGEHIPPLVVWKAVKLQSTWTRGGPPGCQYSCNESGYMQDINFEHWFQNGFVKATALLERPLLLTYDGHGSHITYTTIKTAIDNKIIILALPPHCSHALQPLDVGCFAPLKKAWKEVLNNNQVVTRHGLDKVKFAPCLAELMTKLKPENGAAGFRGAGLYPVNKHAVDHRIVNLDGDNSETEKLPTPRKALRETIFSILSPPEPAQKGPGRRRRVQHEYGEVLTEADVAERIRQDDLHRAEKKRLEALKKNTDANARKEAAAAKKAAAAAKKSAAQKAKAEAKKAKAEAKAKKAGKGKKPKAIQNLDAAFGRALRADLVSSGDDSEDDVDDPVLVRREKDNKWSSGSSDVSDMFIQSDDCFEASPQQVTQRAKLPRRSPSPMSLSPSPPASPRSAPGSPVQVKVIHFTNLFNTFSST
ncbi:MAG: hypothetical protein GY739_20645 [Mesoflavibacter sp.]|nr:hypothetical protein [Mesoflavibacter sp.]